jgi:hypothetical protein
VPLRSAGESRSERPDAEPLPPGALPPKKVAWLHPVELLRTAYHVWLSTVATEFLDRRENLAALDRNGLPDVQRGPKGSLSAEGSAHPTHRATVYGVDAEHNPGELWIDFVADLGDSWEATYAVAVLLASRRLPLQGHPDPLPAADVVVLGGDLVYPTPTRNRYRSNLRSPFAAALPVPSNPAPCMLAIPGNHDWYDGLTNFVREFCQGGFLGGWRLVQRRSYFAVKLVGGWWLWGIDIALDTRIDAPQQTYFLDVLSGRSGSATSGQRFERGDNIILCTAKPCWLDDPRHSAEAYRNLAYFVKDLVEKHGGAVPVILAGDMHHYSRYANDTGDQMIACGGGGSYLMGTHHLPQRIPGLQTTASPDTGRPRAASKSKAEQAERLDLAQEADDFLVASDFPYPSRTDSRRLALGGLFLAFRPANWPFCLLIGLLYWLLAWPLREVLTPLSWQALPGTIELVAEFAVQRGARVVLAAASIVLACVSVAVLANRGSVILRALWGLMLGAAHIGLALLLGWLVSPDSPVTSHVESVLGSHSNGSPYLLRVFLVLIGGLSGGTLAGIYLVVSDRLFGWHRNEVFAAQSIIDYRSFVRMKIETNGSLHLFPIALRRVPRKWRGRVRTAATDPRYEPADDVLRPHLIEGPIGVARRSPVSRPLSFRFHLFE